MKPAGKTQQVFQRLSTEFNIGFGSPSLVLPKN
jgi:hypothetical protein